LEAISRVEVRVSPALLDVCAIPEPRTGLEGKFSLRTTTAMALLGDDTGNPDVFTDARMAEPGLVRRRDRVHVVTVENTPPTRAVVAIEALGRRLEVEADTGLPATDLAAQRSRLERKFLTLVSPVLGDAAAARLAEAALAVEELSSTRELVRLASAERL